MSTVRSERATSEKPRAERSDTLGGVNNENALDAGAKASLSYFVV